MLSTALVEAVNTHLARTGTASLYYYCESKSRQSARAIDLFESWIKQILIHLGIILKPCPAETSLQIHKYYDENGLVPDLDDVIEIFLELISVAAGTICIVDGLDELEDKDLERTLKVVRVLSRDSVKYKCKTFITSRSNLASNLAGLKILQIAIDTDAVQADIHDYVEAAILDKSRKLTANEALMTELKDRLVSKSEGM